MSDRVTVKLEDGIAQVRLSRPDKLNALDPAMFQALRETGRQLAGEPSLRAVVLAGEGRAFCAGLDFQSFAAMARSPETGSDVLGVRRDESPANPAQAAAWVWRELPVPVIAAVHGVAYGGGLQIALAADVRLAAPDARFSVMEIRWGLIPDMTGVQSLRHLVRHDVMKQLVYTGRVVPAPEAVEIGLATELADDPIAAATALARDIASRSPDAIRAAKRLLDEAVTGSPAEGLLLEEKLQRTLIGGPNQVEAVRANLEKRAPRFSDPA